MEGRVEGRLNVVKGQLETMEIAMDGLKAETGCAKTYKKSCESWEDEIETRRETRMAAKHPSTRTEGASEKKMLEGEKSNAMMGNPIGKKG
ncbi:hypothetical protein LR48_Vigan05g091200 [Vigna angularis]|uniref:Uncharacterized protein n=1 Tax=Phaseolus angularis TaxID=3914 RepID=A0A0L9UKM0_PHAAN|nr:hypothetical protein LR48_Vigan05g091200 [Vigna angularis]